MFDNESITDVPLTIGETELMKVMEIEKWRQDRSAWKKAQEGSWKASSKQEAAEPAGNKK